MSDRLACEIKIGGTISTAVAEELRDAVRDANASLEWGGGVFAPENIEELLTAIDDDCLVLRDDERAWGEFEALEEFLRHCATPYDRQTWAKYEYDAEIVKYRPGIGVTGVVVNASGNPVMEVAALQEFVKSLVSLCKYARLRKSDMAGVLRRVRRLQASLQSKLPREMPPLEPFTITDGQSSRERTAT